jgi:K(+)-stimulated pyrophosphate-energized sodium pump
MLRAFIRRRTTLFAVIAVVFSLLAGATPSYASESGLVLPSLSRPDVTFLGYDRPHAAAHRPGRLRRRVVFGLTIYQHLKKLPVHRSMLEVSELIYETCKTYLKTQGKFILILWVFIAAIMVAYFGFLTPHHEAAKGAVAQAADWTQSTPLRVAIILIFSLIGIAGSYSVAWFGIRINTFANSRTAMASLAGKAYPIYSIPLKAGMSIGMVLISVELLMMLAILLFIPARSPGRASSDSPSASRSAPRRFAWPAASSPRSPTSARTS